MSKITVTGKVVEKSEKGESKEKEKGKTILITTHIMSLVEEISDEIVFLLDGKIYFKGTIEGLKKQTKQNDLETAIANVLEESYA